MIEQKKGISLRISPIFFITAAVIGYLNTFEIYGALLWVVVIFVSILVHEMGHALFTRAFGQSAHVELTAFGGVTIPSGPKINLVKEFIVVLAGPVFGFALFLLSKWALGAGMFTGKTAIYILTVSSVVNFIWTVLNLLPVLPLDGGQLMRIIFEGIFGYKGRRGAFIASMIISFVIALAFIYFRLYIISILFFMFAFQNFEVERQLRASSKEDEDGSLKGDLLRAEELLKSGRFQEAIVAFDELRKRSGKGMIYQLATQDLARAHMIEERFSEAYDVLKPNLRSLTDTGKALYHHAAFEMGDYETVVHLAGPCFLALPEGGSSS